MSRAYNNLKSRFERIQHLRNAKSILHMDQAVTMPDSSGHDRDGQLDALSATIHGLLTAVDVGVWLDEADSKSPLLSKEDKHNLYLMRREWVHSCALPEDLAREVTETESKGERLHTQFRDTGDWSKMRDCYAHSFDVMRRVGEAKQAKLGTATVYEALLDTYMAGVSDDGIARELGVLEQKLPSLINQALARQADQPEPLPLQGIFPHDQQLELSRRLATALGFDFTRGRFDMVKGHPMTGGTLGDVRFTTDCVLDNPLESIYSTIHETGHALYRQGTPIALRYQLAGDVMGTHVNESQSRILEVQAGHTPEFFQFLEKQMRDVFNRPDDPALTAENLERLINRAKPSFIRIEADELTYSAHIILRHKIEKSMIDGTIAVDDIPEIWNEGMKKMLGITPPDPSKGHMQDVHWPVGAIGYFPAYTLGDMGAAQLFTAATAQRGDIRPEMAQGNFTPLREWLQGNIHGKGSLLTAAELFTQATGEPLNARHYLEHLSQRFLGKSWESPATVDVPRQSLPILSPS